jgi:tetratricopeptide (TPR) repeat protein
MPSKTARDLEFRALSAVLLAISLLLTACAGPQQRLTQAVFHGDAADVSSLLQASPAAVNTPTILDEPQPACPGRNTLTPLQAAACTGQDTIVKILLDHKADVNLADGAGQAPLLLAVASGRDAVVRLLVASGARLDSTDAAGNTALMLAAREGNRPLVAFLLENGASAQARNRAGETALLLCTDPDIATLLAAKGADPLAADTGGESGLHRAAQNNNPAMARFFLEHDVDARLKNNAGQTALEVARAHAASAVSTAILQRDILRLRTELAAGDQAAQEGRATEALAHYVAALPMAEGIGGAAEENLRVKIVRYAAAMPQPPALPEKAREHLVRASYMLKKGDDVGQVEQEMAAAVRLAPWWAEGYLNLGQLQAQQKNYLEAERNLKLFIAAAPNDPRAQAAQTKIYEIKVDKEEGDKILGMQGDWVGNNGRAYRVSIKGNKMGINDGHLFLNLTVSGSTLSGSYQEQPYPIEHGCTTPGQLHPVNGKIAPDKRGISLEYLYSSFKANYHCVNMAGLPSNCCLLCDEVCDSATVSGTRQVAVQLHPAK